MNANLNSIRAKLEIRPGRLFIGGQWLDWDGARFDQINPNDNQTIGTFAEAGQRGVDLAVAAARHAFDDGPWPTLPAQDRKRILQPIIERIYELEAELATLQTLDNGMPYSFSRHSRASGKSCADILDHHAGWCDKITGETFPRHSSSSNLQYLTYRDPVGVVGAILAWNVPLNMFAIKVGPALASGCTVVLKPSEYTNLAVTRLVEIFAESDLPPGVVNFVTGGAETGAALAGHPGVDKVTFTGSAAVGERIVSVSGANMKRLSLELGGKSAGIVFPEARSVASAATTMMGLCSTFLSGQVCTTPSRALVHRSIFDEFVHHASEQVKQVRFGDPFDPATTSAPIISRAQVERIRNLIDSGIEQGARLAFGGEERDDIPGGGNWIAPALFLGVDPGMRIAREEFFGPVLCAIPFDSEEEAIRLANDSEYGLAGCIFTTDIAQGMRVARSVRTGAIGINGYASVANAPMGGVKRSGLGREGGWASIEAFTEIKTVAINLDG
ncbi:aldehyde dehydrogenase family protein [Paracoccus pantotrophus]|uniref:aldehyde dehydrogenase family protein n=1 Tax=Paracoccus pantotrophus TaxID=82367 RepID=UPI00048E5EAD|nr:aldehyde dehydrogenase family protein [Paracoccus pantotrophus]